MHKAKRRWQADVWVQKLATLRNDWETPLAIAVTSKAAADFSRRERLKTIEPKMSSPHRLKQSKDRLIVQLAAGVESFVCGSAITLPLKAAWG